MICQSYKHESFTFGMDAFKLIAAFGISVNWYYKFKTEIKEDLIDLRIL